MNISAPSQTSVRQIVVATDLSDTSKNALQYAKALAKRYSSHIVLVHVGPSIKYVANPEGGWIEDPVTQRAEEQIEELGAELRIEGYAVEAVSASGLVEHEIMSVAKTHDADLVVVGTHGKQGIERMVFGSDAEALIQRCDFPVLTVGPAAHALQKGAWLLNEIICAVIPGGSSANAAVYAYKLAQENGSNLRLYWILDPNYPSAPDDLLAFEDAFNKALPGGEVRLPQIQSLASNEDPAAGILTAAKKRQADLIVLNAKRAIPGSTHFGLGILPEVLLHAQCPVLTIHSH